MVIINMIGGLGNQLFSYAFGRSMALRRNEGLKFDLSWYDVTHSGAIPREYVMSQYMIQGEQATEAEISANEPGKAMYYWDKVVRRLAPDYHIRCHQRIKNSKRVYFKGFFQSYKYFEEYRDIICQELTLRNELSGKALEMEKEIVNSNSVSVHVRRGDVVTNKKVNETFGLVPMEYYERALKYLSEKVENPKFFIFTDDHQWVRDSFKLPYDLVIVSGNGFHETVDMHLMSKCKHNIIANSTFSWWGAWLNRNIDKIVVMPDRWFIKKNLGKDNDFIPAGWIRL